MTTAANHSADRDPPRGRLDLVAGRDRGASGIDGADGPDGADGLNGVDGGDISGIDFIAVQRSDEFQLLRRRLRRFVFPMSGLFFAWYLTYVLLAAYAHGFMSHRLTGQITVGLALGVLQFGTTMLIMLGYLGYARAMIDPLVASIRARYERSAPAVQPDRGAFS